MRTPSSCATKYTAPIALFRQLAKGRRITSCRPDNGYRAIGWRSDPPAYIVPPPLGEIRNAISTEPIIRKAETPYLVVSFRQYCGRVISQSSFQ